MASTYKSSFFAYGICVRESTFHFSPRIRKVEKAIIAKNKSDVSG
jgi:hypothetical protein